MQKKVKVELFSKPDCCLCDDVKSLLYELKDEIDFELVEIDIRQDAELFETYKERIPVGFINGKKAFKYRIDRTSLLNLLKAST